MLVRPRVKYFLVILGDSCPDHVVDMAILADTSRSMNANMRTQLISLVDKLLDNLGVSSEGNHYGIVTFDFNAAVHNTFIDPQYHNKENLKSKLEDSVTPIPKGWGTRTDIAMHLAANKLFTLEGGDRPEAKNAMLILTDGKPKIANTDTKPPIPFSHIAEALEVSLAKSEFSKFLENARRKMLLWKKLVFGMTFSIALPAKATNHPKSSKFICCLWGTGMC